MIKRLITNQLIADIKSGHVTALFGARRTGKTTLMNVIVKHFKNKKSLVLNGEDYDVAKLLSSLKQEVYNNLVSGYDILFVDEAQSIPNIGKSLKLLVDTNPDVAVFITGSASFDLRTKIGEPLTGRSRFFTLYPFSLSEISDDYINILKKLPEFLIYGSYPQIMLAPDEKTKRFTLENIRNGYLLKDVLQIENIKDSLFIINLLKLLAFQIGNDVSYNELARNLNTTVKTVQRYLEILEKVFVIFRLQGFSRNLRKEISKSPRFFFWDNGIRNAIISNFSTIDNRDDVGRLWENFCIAERIKKQKYSESFSEFYFWRTYDRQEIDLIETNNNAIDAFEFKWGEKTAKAPKVFIKSYPNANFSTVNKLNFYNFLK